MFRVLFYLIIILVVLPSPLQAASFILKRAIITWDNGLIDDSASSTTFTINGTMQANGNVLTQNITYCEYGVCDKVVDNASGTITYVHHNLAYFTVRRHEDNLSEEITLQAIVPNIITLYVYEDGTIEAHEWEPSERIGKIMDDDVTSSGSVAKGIAPALKLSREAD